MREEAFLTAPGWRRRHVALDPRSVAVYVRDGGARGRATGAGAGGGGGWWWACAGVARARRDGSGRRAERRKRRKRRGWGRGWGWGWRGGAHETAGHRAIVELLARDRVGAEGGLAEADGVH